MISRYIFEYQKLFEKASSEQPNARPGILILVENPGTPKFKFHVLTTMESRLVKLVLEAILEGIDVIQ